MAFDKEVEERLESIGLPFNRYGIDPYGISREHLAWFYSTIKPTGSLGSMEPINTASRFWRRTRAR